MPSEPLIDAYNAAMVRRSRSGLEIDGVGCFRPVEPSSVVVMVRWHMGPRRRALIVSALRALADHIEQQRAPAAPGPRRGSTPTG